MRAIIHIEEGDQLDGKALALAMLSTTGIRLEILESTLAEKVMAELRSRRVAFTTAKFMTVNGLSPSLCGAQVIANGMSEDAAIPENQTVIFRNKKAEPRKRRGGRPKGAKNKKNQPEVVAHPNMPAVPVVARGIPAHSAPIAPEERLPAQVDLQKGDWG